MNRRRKFDEIEDSAVRDASEFTSVRDHKRRRNEATEIEDRLESLIYRVGEKSTSSLESNLEGLASVLEADISNYKGKILKILSDCAVNMPEKTTIYSTLVGLLNAKNYNFGGEFMDMMTRRLKEALKNCMWKTARYIVRFFADMVNCHVISAVSLLHLYHSFLETAQDDNGPQVRSDTYVYAVLSSLPWVGRELNDKKEKEFVRLLKHIEIYIRKRSTKHLPGLKVWKSDRPHPQEEYLDCLWAQVLKLKSDDWREKHTTRPYTSFDNVLCEALQHTIPAITPPPHHPDNTYPFPWVVFRLNSITVMLLHGRLNQHLKLPCVYPEEVIKLLRIVHRIREQLSKTPKFRLFDYTDCPDGPVLPGAHSIERYLIEEHLHNIIKESHEERKICAAALLEFPSKQNIPLEYMIVEVIFAEMFHLPVMRYHEVCYGALLIELCKMQPTTMPQVLAQAVELLYDRIDTMNSCCFERFVSWFAYHLSNFQFKWSWDDWIAAAQLDHEQPRAKFVAEVLKKCMRLSYRQRIAEVVPEQFDCFIPPKPTCNFKFHPDTGSDLPGCDTAQALMTAIKNKATHEDVLKVLQALANPLKEMDEEPPYNPAQIEVFTQTLLFLGSKTFSHSFVGINKFVNIFETLIAGQEEAQLVILKSIYELWSTHHQMIVVLVDKLVRTQIVKCATVANWIFSNEMRDEFTKHYIWEILHATIRKMNKHVNLLQRNLMEARERRRRHDGSESESEFDEDESRPKPTEEEIEKMEEKLETAQADQKNLFLIIFQRFIMILSEHLVSCDTDGRDYNTHWYKWTIGRLNQIFMIHNIQVERYSQTLSTLLFTQDLDPHILESFNQFVSLRA